jgi:tRNA threonylcarbamoyladenosine biosynthesis protein TsaE
MSERSHFLPDEAATARLGAALAAVLEPGTVVHLHGELGAGKTTLVRGFLRARGHQGAVKSPTYTLVESYPLADGELHHFDLYRLGEPDELDYLGLDGYFHGAAICLVEWPEKGGAALPAPDLALHLHHLEPGRMVRLRAEKTLLEKLDLLLKSTQY